MAVGGVLRRCERKLAVRIPSDRVFDQSFGGAVPTSEFFVLTEAVGKLDSVFEAARYQDVPLKTYLLKESLQVVERKLAAHTGLEPVISALRGQRVNRLHQCAAEDSNYRGAVARIAS